jgi:2-C-methyl-D-erythritol 4-phosphate cytidylyltransferase/2-C-methyl-D-erythritol 2,4-cyclodiphosphate synthase
LTTVGLVLVAAGSGTRLGFGIPKALVEIDGVSLLERSLTTVQSLDVAAVSIAAPPTHLDDVARIARNAGVDAVVISGGDTRAESVRNAVEALGDVEVVLIHDVARAFTPGDVFERVIAAVTETGDGVVPVLPVTDTIVVLDGDRIVDGTDRERLARVQTPQGFPAARYRDAILSADANATDDSSVWRASGGVVRTVAGDERAHKITTPDDIARFSTSTRVGLGTDTHAFDDASPLWLACLEWPGEVGLSGHSDGDAVAHALTDAILSAAGLGDIGGLFGTDDPALDGAHGRVFLDGALAALAAAGFRLTSASVQIVANRPKIGPRRHEIEAALSAILGVPVSVSATTTDGLGFTGEGRGITAVAIAHVAPR